MAPELTDQSFRKEVLEADLPVLVDFWGPGCQPCSQLGPIIDTLAEKTQEMAKVYKVNVYSHLWQQIL